VAASFPFMQIDNGNLVDQLQIEKHGISETEADEYPHKMWSSSFQRVIDANDKLSCKTRAAERASFVFICFGIRNC